MNRDLHRRPHRCARLLFALAALALPGCRFDLCVDGAAAEPTRSESAPIIGGTVDAENRSTVALLLTSGSGAHGLCSGTVIARSGSTGYVLTAAHCVTGSVDKVIDAVDWRDCTPAGDASKCFASYVPTAWFADPSYDPTTHVHDFAIVTFAGATAATPITPVAAADDLSVGMPIELSGFGRTYAGTDNPALFQYERHHVTTAVGGLPPAFLHVDATTGKTACFGDSGGPAYIGQGADKLVVGVASAADQNCAIAALYGRVADVYASFILPSIPAPDAPGDAPPAPVCESCLQGALSSVAQADGVCGAERAACAADAHCDFVAKCVAACATPDQDCYVGCATGHTPGVVAFNELTNCLVCGACAASCEAWSCEGASASSSTASSSTGSATTGASGAGSSTSTSNSSGTGAGGAHGEPGSADGGAGGGAPDSADGAAIGGFCMPATVSCSVASGASAPGSAIGAVVLAMGCAAALRRARRRS